MNHGVKEMQALADRYEARFGNLTDIAHPSILTDPRFAELLERAVLTGQALDRAAIDAAFNSPGWEELQ